MHLSKTQSILIITGVLLLVLLGLYAYLYYDFDATANDIITSSSEVYKDQNQEQNVISLRQQIDSVKSDATLLDSLFIANDQVANFIQDLETVADTSGVTHTLSVDSQDDPSLDPYNKEWLKFHLSTEGSWQDNVRFLLLLENMPYKSFISNVSFTLSGDPTASSSHALPQWSGNIDISFIQNK